MFNQQSTAYKAFPADFSCTLNDPESQVVTDQPPSNVVTFTKYTSPDTLSKIYRLEGGQIQKEAGAQMWRGSAERMCIPFSEFGRVLSSCSSNQAFGYGSHSNRYPDVVGIVTNGKEKLADNILARTKDHYFYQHDTGVLMLDHDPNRYGETYSLETLLSLLVEIHPDIKKAARLQRGSVSAGVTKAGDSPKLNQGFHIYVPVANAADIPRYGKLLFEQLWLHGYGFIALARNGALLERSPIDQAVFSPERLDFVGKPIIIGSGLETTPPVTTYFEGGLLDTESLRNLTDDEVATVMQMKAEKKASIKPESIKKQGIWKDAKIGEMVANGIAIEKATETINLMFSGSCKNIVGSYMLEFATGSVSVDEVLQHHEDYDKKALADPIEGKAYGASTAKFYWNDGKPVINSMAHGGMKYLLKPDPDKQLLEKWQRELVEHVQTFNRTHANVMIAGKNRILRQEYKGFDSNWQPAFCFYSRKEISQVYDNQQIKTGEKTVNGILRDIYANPLMAWVRHPQCRTYTGGIVFLPNQPAPEGYFNTWQGYTVSPEQNDLLLGPIYAHIRDVVCAGKTELSEYVLNWIAYTFQHPDKPAGTALVLRGEKGSGKGTLGHFLRGIWGVHGLHISHAKHLVGNFNGHLGEVCFLFADEAFFSGDKQHEGMLKAMVTEPTIIVERKGLDAVQQPNYLKIFMSTNAEFAVPASRDERRYCVMDVASSHIGNTAYFQALHNACQSAEVQAAFLHDMLSRDLTGWHSGKIPESGGLRAQRYFSMNSCQQWLAEALSDGYFRTSGDVSWALEISTAQLFNAYSTWCDTNKVGEFRRIKKAALSAYLGKIYLKTIHVGQRGTRGYRFGSLENAVALFEAYEKIDLEELGGEK